MSLARILICAARIQGLREHAERILHAIGDPEFLTPPRISGWAASL